MQLFLSHFFAINAANCFISEKDGQDYKFN